jgi:hypothetical protein
VVLPVDLEQQVRVVEWPGGDGLATLYREIGCETVDLRTVGDLGFWVDDEGAVGEKWAANGRAAWLALVVGDQSVLVAGTVVVTLAAPDEEGDTQGLTREVAEWLAAAARAVPEHDPEELTADLRQMVGRGSLVMTLDENGVPDGFVV